MIVHRRLDTFDRRARISTWLFGICMRVAANYRRRRRWTREVLSGGFEDERPAALAQADDILVRREQRELAETALNRLEVAKRATFVMFEIESLSCQEIAELMNVPVGTVYSRLHSARRQLEKHLSRELARRGLGNS
jgi:RNA polymerase sigma-70 factor (ECF subfamily)